MRPEPTRDSPPPFVFGTTVGLVESLDWKVQLTPANATQ
jgi:hypothetical protein